MKNLFSKIGVLAGTGLIALCAAAPASAQTTLKVEVPFAFVAGGQTHAAGAYTVRMNKSLHRLELQAADESLGQVMLLNSAPVSRAKGSDGAVAVLQFATYGDTRVLRGVYPRNESQGYQLQPTKVEIEIANAGGAGSSRARTVR